MDDESGDRVDGADVWRREAVSWFQRGGEA